MSGSVASEGVPGLAEALMVDSWAACWAVGPVLERPKVVECRIVGVRHRMMAWHLRKAVWA